MKFSKTSVGGTVEILAADDFVAIPIKVDETSTVKAGTPMTSAGKKIVSTSYATAAGMLLYDVDPTENPNGALLVQGVVDKAKAQEHSGVTLDTTFAVPGIILRDKISCYIPVLILNLYLPNIVLVIDRAQIRA